MISLIIFSKDRAFQLEALLSSIKANCDIFNNISVIWKATDKEYERGYEQLKQSYSGIYFMKQCESLKTDVYLLLQTTSEYTCFMVDDLIAYRRIKNIIAVKSPIIEKEINSQNEADLPDNIRTYIPNWQISEKSCCFSLRLSKNEPQVTPDSHCIFDWTKEIKYFGYPFSLDGHIFRTAYIKPLIEKIKFRNPNKLEANLQGYKKQAPKYMNCLNQSVVVSLPINRVSDTASASYGEKYPHTAKELNDRFLAGERMDWELMDFSNINMPHQEIELKFKKC